MDPCPVMMATSECGSVIFDCFSNSTPDMVGSFRSVRIKSGASDSSRASAASAVSASLHAYPSVFPIVMHNRKYAGRSEEHTSELQSQSNLVCRLLLEKKHIVMSARG